MGNFGWNEKYRINITEIDLQHKRLFELIAQLEDAMRTGKGKDILGKVLDELIAYTHTHFSHEETLLSKHQYPSLTDHKKVHEGFVKQVGDYQQKFKRGNMFITIEVMDLLQNWLVNHIGKTDQQYATFLAGKGVK